MEFNGSMGSCFVCDKGCGWGRVQEVNLPPEGCNVGRMG